MLRKFTEADAARVRETQAAIFGATPATDRRDDGSHNWLRDKCRDWINRQPDARVWNNDSGVDKQTGIPYGTPGTSDLIGWRLVSFCLNDDSPGETRMYAFIPQFVAIEIKRGRDKERVKQSGFLRDVKAANGIAITVRDSLDDLRRKWKEATR